MPRKGHTQKREVLADPMYNSVVAVSYTHLPYAVSDYYMESRKAQAHAMENAKQVILDVAKDFEKISGRKYGLIEEYKMEDAEYAVVIIGSAAGTTKDAIDHMRENGEKVGLVDVYKRQGFK